MAPLTKTMAPNTPATPAVASRPRSEPASNGLRALPAFARSVLVSAPDLKSASLYPALPFDGSLASRYRAIAKLLPADVLAERASGAISIPLFLMLRPDAVFMEHSSWDDLLDNRRKGGSDSDARQMIHNEALRRYFSGHLTPNDLVRIEVQPPLGPGGRSELTFSLLGTPIFTPDGLFGMRELTSFGSGFDIDQEMKHDVEYVELTAALINELDDLETLSYGPLRQTTQTPEDFALNDILGIEARVHIAMRLVDVWQCKTGPPLAPAATLIDRYNKILGIAHRTSEFAKTWHNDEENTMESAGQANERRGSSGHWYSAAGWAFVEGLEVVGTLGNHNTRTRIAEAYQRGDISWNEAKHLVNSSARRTILAAAVASTLGPALGRFGAAFSASAEIGTTGARAIGAFGGTITSAASLGSETLMTKVGPAGLSPTGQNIWDAGSPDAKAWVIGLVLGGAFGAAGAEPKIAEKAEPAIAAQPKPVADVPPKPDADLQPKPVADVQPTPDADLQPKPPAGSPPTPATAPTPSAVGALQRMLLRRLFWLRTRLGQPVMEGVSEHHIFMGSGTDTAALVDSGSPAFSMRTPGPINNSPFEFAPQSNQPDLPNFGSSEAADAAVATTPAAAVSAAPGALPAAASTSLSVASSIATVAANLLQSVRRMLPFGYRPAPGERNVSRQQWRLFNSGVRNENAMQASFGEQAPFQFGPQVVIDRVRTTTRSGRQVQGLGTVALTPAQRAAVARYHGKALTGPLLAAWQRTANAAELAAMTRVRQLWAQGTPQSRSAAHELAEKTFDNHRRRFYAAVRRDASALGIFLSMGLQFEGSNTSAPFYTMPDGTRELMSLEHIIRKVDDATLAVDGPNLMLLLQDLNSAYLEQIRAADPFP